MAAIDGSGLGQFRESVSEIHIGRPDGGNEVQGPVQIARFSRIAIIVVSAGGRGFHESLQETNIGRAEGFGRLQSFLVIR